VAASAKISKTWPCVPDPWPFKPKINRLRHSVEDYLLCQVSSHSDQVLTFYRASAHTHTHTHTHTSWRSDRNIRAAVLRRRRG